MAIDSQVIRVTSKGRATIPKQLRDEFDIQTPGRVRMRATADGIPIERVSTPEELAGDVADMTDDQGRTPMEVLHAGRRADRATLMSDWERSDYERTRYYSIPVT